MPCGLDLELVALDPLCYAEFLLFLLAVFILIIITSLLYRASLAC